MMEFITQWLVGITCAAMIVALAEGLTPEGTVRKIGQLTGGLVLLLAIVQPVLQVDGDALARAFTEYRATLNSGEVQLEDTNIDLVKVLIEKEANTYIQDKAAALGATIQVVCTARVEGDVTYPIPHSVVIQGTLNEHQQTALARQIEVDFAIPIERQTYQTEDVK